MADTSPSLDPFALWRDLVSQMSKGANEWANRGMQTDEFSAGMNKLLGPMLVFGKLSTKAKQRYFEAMNLPSRSDVEALADRLQAIEDKLVDLAALLDRPRGGAAEATARGSTSASAQAARLPRTKKPPPEAAEARPGPRSAPQRIAPSTPRRRKTRA